MAKLKVCPFCSSKNVSASIGRQGQQPFHYVECEDCGAAGAGHETIEAAIAAWEKRHVDIRLIQERGTARRELETARAVIRSFRKTGNIPYSSNSIYCANHDVHFGENEVCIQCYRAEREGSR